MPPGNGAWGCTGCDELFTSLSAFDKHHTLRPEAEGGGVICYEPESVGLVLREKTIAGEVWTMWGWPPPEDGGYWNNREKDEVRA